MSHYFSLAALSLDKTFRYSLFYPLNEAVSRIGRLLACIGRVLTHSANMAQQKVELNHQYTI